MPLYMDRHDLPESVSAEEVARLHQEDLKIQSEFGCKGLTYWFDGQRNTAFCLIEAPNKQALIEMHNHAHGAVPNSIIEVDPSLVESFLGRIEDPEGVRGSEMPIIDDPAYRALLLIKIRWKQLGQDLEEINRVKSAFREDINRIVTERQGKQVQFQPMGLLFSFHSVNKAFQAAMKMRQRYRRHLGQFPGVELKIGLSSGVPFDKENELFRTTVDLVRHLAESVTGEMVLSSEISNALEAEHVQLPTKDAGLRRLHPEEELFLNKFLEFTERHWNNPGLKIDKFTASLGLSKAQLYRKVKSLTGESPNHFIKFYRMEKALELLMEKKGNISEVAFDTGYNSAAYFSRCFYETYGVLPSGI